MKKQIESAETAERAKSITLDQIVAEPSTSRFNRETTVAASFNTVSVGRIVALHQASALVDFPANVSGELVPARSLVPVSDKEIGKDVVLAFEENDPARPIILGVLQSGDGSAADSARTHPTTQLPEIQLDGETLIMSAKKEIVLRCGKASITLTSAGKLLIRGTYVLSRSSGVNRILGGSVQIN
jgi:hypothetical protein